MIDEQQANLSHGKNHMEAEQISVLVVDDSAEDRKFIRAFLENRGYVVDEAGDGVEALTCIGKTEPDIILSDLEMPKMDGLQLLGALRKNIPDIPFIIVSGAGTMDDIILALRYGAWDYLTKPINPIELLQYSIERAMERVELIMANNKKKDDLEELVRLRTFDLLSQNKSYEREIKERQKQQKLARNAVDEWRRTVDALPEMIAIIDSERHIHRLNKPMQEFFGVEENGLIGSLCIFCGSNQKCIQSEVISEGLSHKKELYFEDRQVYLELNVIPYTSMDGSFVGSIHVFRDITGEIEAEKAKGNLQAKVLHAQKLESVGQLASGIAHEINTPTQFVSSNVSYLNETFTDIVSCFEEILNKADREPLGKDAILEIMENYDWSFIKEETSSALEQSEEGLNRITSIVRAMKEFSHPGSRELEPVDINHLIDVTVTVARNEWKYAANVTLELDENLPRVDCLADELGQVILNLLVNAAHAIKEKVGKNPESGKGDIVISTSISGENICISMEDNGSGIPAYAQEKIFDPFFTTKGVGEGTGQGLAIAYDVITNKHNGKLSFTTRQGEGTCFDILLPVKQKRSDS